jgi:enoyl-CoA hydratase/carnithine racemase
VNFVTKRASAVTTTVREGLAIVRMDREHGNAINEDLVAGLMTASQQVGADPDVRGVLLASGGKLFCPGLDLQDLALLDRRKMARFMVTFRDLLLDLFTLPKPMVAAVSGPAMAGGCILSLTADWRILRRGALIGLNEIKVGVPLPFSVARLLNDSVHRPRLEEVALLGRNYVDESAVATGLVQELHEESGFEEHCLRRLEEFAGKDLRAFAATKKHLRHAAAAQMEAEDQRHQKEWLDCWFSSETRKRIDQIVAGLRARSA